MCSTKYSPKFRSTSAGNASIPMSFSIPFEARSSLDNRFLCLLAFHISFSMLCASQV